MSQSAIPHEIEKHLRESLAAEQWERIGIHHHHGVDVPLFSLHSKHSSGIGEFLDLIPLIDWCAELGFDVIQLLPLNDTGPDSSPYNAQTAFGLNPIHLSLQSLPGWDQDPECVGLIQQLTKLNRLKRVDYDRIRPLRAAFLKRYLGLFGAEILVDAHYQAFTEEQDFWLPAYCLFKALKEEDPRYWKQWPKAKRSYSPDLATQYQSAIEFHSMLQYLCFRQMQRVKEYGDEQKVLIKGDLPILISPDSADVWRFQEYFQMEFSAGAPPDMYSPKGQKWGFPIYNWEALAKDDYAWWKQRLKCAESCYHLYRLDHVLGFFRIWAIPRSKGAKEGHYEPMDESVWLDQGRHLLSLLLESSSMLPIGEDLGVVLDGLRECMHDLGIPGTKVPRWERAWNEDQRFLAPQDFNPVSMTTVSTHDSETIGLWWRDLPEEAQAYAKQKSWIYEPEISHTQRFTLLSESHRAGSLFHINLLQEYLALVPELVWQKPEDERINVPGKLSAKNWSYRYRRRVETITSNEILAHEIRMLLTDSEVTA